MDCNNCTLDMSPGTLILCDANTGNPNDFNRMDCIRQTGVNHDITIRGGTIDCNNFGWGDSINKGIMLNGYYGDVNLCYNFTIDGVTILRARNEGLAIEYSRNGVVRNCHVSECGWSGITMAQVVYGLVYNNDVNNCGLKGGNPPLSRNISSLGCKHLDIFDNTVTNARQGGIGVNADAIYIYRSENISIHNNTIVDCNGAAGIITNAIGDYTSNLNIRDNYVSTRAGSGQQGIWLDCVKNFEVTGNTCKPDGGYWIYVTSNNSTGRIASNRYPSSKIAVISGTGINSFSGSTVFTGSIKAAQADYLHPALDATDISTHTDVNTLDYPRSVVAAAVSHNNLTYIRVQLGGIDQFGAAYSALLTLNDSDYWTASSPPLVRVDLVKCYDRTGSGVGDTINVGTNRTIGLGRTLLAATDILKVERNGVGISVPAIDIINGAATMNAITDGDNFTFHIKDNLNWPITP
jgi:hypothetical protein